MEAPTCNNLWRDWMNSDPNDPLVIECKKRLALYSKADWEKMSSEATYLTEMLGELVKYNIPHKSKIAEKAFDELVNHFTVYFFPINKMYILKLADMSGKTGSEYNKFFNKFYDGLGEYLSKLVPLYLHKVANVKWDVR